MKIAFVTPWYGEHASGGMETVTRQTATRLHQAGYDVEVFTTCIRSFQADWATNHYRPGLDHVGGVPVRRFAVEPRDKMAFDRVNAMLMQGRPVSEADEQTFLREMFRCPALLDFMAQAQEDTLFFFSPYMFPTTYRGAYLFPRRSALIPCLHDEAYAYLNVFRDLMPRVRTQLFFVHAEKALAERLYDAPPGQIREVIGAGVDDDVTADGARFHRKFDIQGPFFLYVGRKEPGKNVPHLLRYWQRYGDLRGRAPALVLLGQGQLALPPRANIVDLGFVSRQDKMDAYAAATALVQPSLNESFSLVLMESWLVQTPALVDGRCTVTREHVQRANGGLYYTNFAEFVATVDYLLENTAVRQKMGRNGREYVLAHYRWPDILAQYARVIAEMAPEEVNVHV